MNLLNYSVAASFLYLIVFLLGWLINFSRSPSFTILPKLYGIEAVGRVSGIQNTFASLGALVLPLMLGYLRDATSTYGLGLTILSILMLIGAISAAMVRAPRTG